MTINKLAMLCLFLTLLLFQNTTLAQSKVSGQVTDINGEGLVFANVILLSSIDSSMITGDLSDENGKYSLSLEYDYPVIIQLSYLGYENFLSEAITLIPNNEYEYQTVILSEGIALDEVNIVAKKPLFEQRIDRMIVNVANSVTSAGSTALEVLERSPGVSVNRQSNVLSLIGKQGVVIMINNKVTYQPVSSLVQMLDGMSAENIEKIELITTPPANLDAEGNAGFINIIMKKRTDVGLNGNYAISLGYGMKAIGSGTVHGNFRSSKLNIFTDYNYSDRGVIQDFYNTRQVNYQNTSTTNNLWADRNTQQTNHFARLGLDYQISDQTIIGFLTSAYSNKWQMTADNADETLIDTELVQRTSTINSETNHWEHFMSNINLEHKIGVNQKLNLNFDYLLYRDNNPNEYLTDFFDGGVNFDRSENTRSDKYTPITIRVGQADYINEINSELKLTFGAKSALSTFENDVSASVLNAGNWEYIDQFTNQSDLKEIVMAGYGSADWKLNDQHAFKFGLRYEYTDSKLNTAKEGLVVDRQFGKLFPSIFYSNTLNKNTSFNLSYNKRITRPTFNQMAPFAIFLSPTTFFFGNANLQPAIADNYKVGLSYKSYILNIQYAIEDSTLSNYQGRVNIMTNQQSWEPTNLSQSKNLSTTLAVPVYIGNHWQMQNNFSLIWLQNQSYYDNIFVEIDQSTFQLNSTQSFELGKAFSFELDGFYRSATYFGRSRIDPNFRISAGFQKKFKYGGSLRFNVRDIFDSSQWNTSTAIPDSGFTTEGVFDFSNRTFSISYSNSFGNNKLKSARKRITGSENERKRIQ